MHERNKNECWNMVEIDPDATGQNWRAGVRRLRKLKLCAIYDFTFQPSGVKGPSAVDS